MIESTVVNIEDIEKSTYCPIARVSCRNFKQMKYFSNLRIIQKFTIIFSILLGSVLTSYAIVFWFNMKQKQQALQIDVAGRNRMLSQRIAAMALLIDRDNVTQVERTKEEVKKALVLMQTSLTALKNGGVVPGVEGNLELPNAPEQIVQRIIEIEEYLIGYQKIVEVLVREPRLILSGDSAIGPNPTFAEAMNDMELRIMEGKLLKLNVELTQLFVKQGFDTTLFLKALVFLLLINLTIIGFAYYVLKKTIRPLATIAQHTRLLSEGQLPPAIAVSQADEIGEITSHMNTLSLNIGTATAFAKSVGTGNLETDTKVFDGKGELSHALYAMRDNLKLAASEDKKRNWSSEGLAKFSDIARAHADLKSLAENSITYLVKYLKCAQGSLFTVNDTNHHDTFLELTACYAYSRKKFLNKKIAPGEGLAGQVYLEKQTAYLKEIPKDYVKITSGLGESNPTVLLIVPLKVDEKIEGIIEVASFTEFAPHEILFVEKLAETIASIIVSTKVNERTKQLLEVSQQQAEEMKAQEEEMRQNMEELTATQEETSRKEMELNNQVTAINNSMAAVEFGIDGTIESANEIFLRTMGYSLDEIKGKHHSMFVDSAHAQSEDYKRFWTELAFKSHSGEFSQIGKRGKKVWLQASYTPIQNKMGVTYKVIKFAQDITERKMKEYHLN